MKIKAFFDERTWTITYLVWSAKTHDAIIIDPVLDYDPTTSKVWDESIQAVAQFTNEKKLNVHMILETHAHADHLTGAQKFKIMFPKAKIGIGEHITKVQETFKELWSLPPEFQTDGSQFDLLLEENKEYTAGDLKFTVIHTPGHTPACSSYIFEDAVFTGDALFMPDSGVARCDFPGGDAETLYNSVHNKLYSLPDDTRIFTAHDYQPGGRKLQYESTIADSKSNNIHLKMETSLEDFVKMRTERDKTLSPPKLLRPSIQVNVNAGVVPNHFLEN